MVFGCLATVVNALRLVTSGGSFFFFLARFTAPAATCLTYHTYRPTILLEHRNHFYVFLAESSHWERSVIDVLLVLFVHKKNVF